MAYPAVLLFTWWRNPPDQRHRGHFLAGIPLVILIVLTMRLGWSGMNWDRIRCSAAAVIYGSRAEGALSIEEFLSGLTLIALAAAAGGTRAGACWRIGPAARCSRRAVRRRGR